MVWQDFQFACGVYPAHDSFVATVKAEVEDNVKRLRHHASMTVFCGNNEGSCGLIFLWKLSLTIECRLSDGAPMGR